MGFPMMTSLMSVSHADIFNATLNLYNKMVCNGPNTSNKCDR